jgi:hypothetical protein
MLQKEDRLGDEQRVSKREKEMELILYTLPAISGHMDQSTSQQPHRSSDITH